jgi:hypothetical protein
MLLLLHLLHYSHLLVDHSHHILHRKVVHDEHVERVSKLLLVYYCEHDHLLLRVVAFLAVR